MSSVHRHSDSTGCLRTNPAAPRPVDCPAPPRRRTWLPTAFLLTGLLALASASLAAPAPYLDLLRAKRAGKPNIVVILADDLGYGDLGCYGQQRIRTPHLDRLAGEGIRFTQCYAGAPLSTPSRAVLLTGIRPGLNRIRTDGRDHLDPGDLTVAGLLQRAGYRTCAVGKWGLGKEPSTGHPNAMGFDEWLGYLESVQAHDYYPAQLSRNSNLLEIAGNQFGQQNVYAPDLLTKTAINFITNNRAIPFFLYLAYPTPHANNELGRLQGNGMQVPDTAPYTAETWPAPEKAKAAMITRLDADIGRILATLDRLELARETIVFFTSDNGPHREGGVDPSFFKSAGPLRGGKRELYEGGLRVPMIARWTDNIPAGKVSSLPWSFTDFLPTCAALAKTGLPRGLDGASVLPTLLGSTQSEPPGPLYFESREPGFHQALRSGEWKAVRHGTNAPLELYDLKTDPAETTDAAAHHPDVVTRLSELLRSYGG